MKERESVCLDVGGMQSGLLDFCDLAESAAPSLTCVCHLALPCWLRSQLEGLEMSLRAQEGSSTRAEWEDTAPQKFNPPLLPKSRESYTWGSDADNTTHFLSL